MYWADFRKITKPFNANGGSLNIEAALVNLWLHSGRRNSGK